MDPREANAPPEAPGSRPDRGHVEGGGGSSGAPTEAPQSGADGGAPGDRATGSVAVRLQDGATVRLRGARGDDREALRHLFLGLGDRTRYLYYQAGVPATPTWADRFAALGRVDGRSAFALVAEVGEAASGGAEVVGLGRLDLDSEDGRAAEVALLLADAWQSRGLGGFILRRLSAEACARAVSVITCHVLWENRRMLRLARRVFPRLEIACAQGSSVLTATLGSSGSPGPLPPHPCFDRPPPDSTFPGQAA